MRAWLGPLALAGSFVAGCHDRPPAARAAAVETPPPPTRPAGLWEQTMTRDGVAPPLIGRARVCLDAAGAGRLPQMGLLAGRRACGQASGRRATDGGYIFASTCDLGPAGVTEVSGRLMRRSPTWFEGREESVTHGAALASLNGRHVSEMTARWLGPCPAGMAAGEMQMANGMKVNLARAAAAASVMGVR